MNIPGSSNGRMRLSESRHGGSTPSLGTRNKYDWTEVSRYYENHSANQTIKHFGMAKETWQKAIRRGDLISRGREVIPIEELLVENRPQTNRSHLKRRLLAAKLLEYRCQLCKLTEWRGKPISLHLDHKNGRFKDNRLENLWLLCPNCHDQQPTSNGKNKKYK